MVQTIMLANAIRLKAPRDEVFKFLTDLDQVKRLVPDHIKIVPIEGTIAKPGMKVQWESTRKDGTVVKWEEQYTIVEPDKRLDYEMLGSPELFHGSMRFLETYDGTLLVFEEIIGGALAEKRDPKDHDDQMLGYLAKLKEIIEEGK